MKQRKALTKVTATALSVAMIAGWMSACSGGSSSSSEAAGESGYIEAPYTADASQTPTEYLAPVFYENEGGPTISVVYGGVIVEDGKYFRDSDNDQELDAFEDWRLTTEERVADLLGKMTQEQRIGLLQNALMCSPAVASADEVYDENGSVILSQLVALSDGGDNSSSAYAASGILDAYTRSGVIRKDTDTETGALFNNALNMMAEYVGVTKGEVTIPYMLISNPMISGYPTALGFGAAATGDGNADFIVDFAELDAEIWDAKGIHQMYGPQIDLVTDPRWSRIGGTYTEDPDMMAQIATALVTGYQHGADGAQAGDVALIIKHFPGDGASENGFESHYGMGQWRIYSTEGSLENYQLVGFQAAIDAGVAGIMPGYSRPTLDARSVSQSYRGVTVDGEEIANAYNTTILQTLLRDTMGFEGFINSDSGIIGEGEAYATNFGAEDMTAAERYATVINAGTDVVGDAFTAVLDYGATAEAVTSGLVTEEAFDRATTNRMTSWIDLGMFDNPYRDPAESKAVGEQYAEARDEMKADVNHKSVVLMKNHDDVLPLTDTSKAVYLASFTDSGENDSNIESWTAAIKAAGYTIVDDEAQADIAILDVVPGGVANATEYMNNINLVEDFEEEHVDPNTGEKDGEIVEVTTLQDVDDIADIANTLHANGGIVIASINISSPWILTNLEPYCDALVGSFSTSAQARMDVLTGAYAPTGKLPVTMVSCDEVIAVNEQTLSDGNTYDICVSPNDVPGYDKDQYIDDSVLAQSPSGSYAYQDADGSLYVSGFGLSMDVSGVSAANSAPAAGASGEAASSSASATASGAETSNTMLDINYEALPDEFVGTWTLTAAYTENDGILEVPADACTVEIELSIDGNKLVDEPNYIHADATNLSGTMSFNYSGIDVDDYRCSSNWADWTTVNVIGEGNAEFCGANEIKIRDDDNGVFFDVLTGVSIDGIELFDVIAVNDEGQLIIGYSDGHIVNDPSATWAYAYIFTKA